MRLRATTDTKLENAPHILINATMKSIEITLVNASKLIKLKMNDNKIDHVVVDYRECYD